MKDKKAYLLYMTPEEHRLLVERAKKLDISIKGLIFLSLYFFLEHKLKDKKK